MGWYQRVFNVFRSKSVSVNVDDELAFHLEELTDELVSRGLTREQARQEAARRFGNYTSRREEVGDVAFARWLQRLVSDLRYGSRQLRAAPAFTIVAVLSLALGIGANSAIFQLINAIGLRGLPVRHPSELVAVDAAPGFYASGWSVGRHRVFTYHPGRRALPSAGGVLRSAGIRHDAVQPQRRRRRALCRGPVRHPQFPRRTRRRARPRELAAS